MIMISSVQKLDKDILISSRYDHLLAKAMKNLEDKAEVDDDLLSKASTRRLKRFIADISGSILYFHMYFVVKLFFIQVYIC